RSSPPSYGYRLPRRFGTGVIHRTSGAGKIPIIGGRPRAIAAERWTGDGPEVPERGPRPFGPGLEFGPHDARVHAPVQTALAQNHIGGGDNVFAPHRLSEPHDALAHELGAWDRVGLRCRSRPASAPCRKGFRRFESGRALGNSPRLTCGVSRDQCRRLLAIAFRRGAEFCSSLLETLQERCIPTCVP